MHASGFIKRAFAQTRLRALYELRFFEAFLGILGEGAPLVQYLCTT